MAFWESLPYVVMAVAGRKQQNLNQCERAWQLAKVGWEMPRSPYSPRQKLKPSKWQSIYGIRLVLAARRVIPKTGDRVTGMQFFHSGQSFQIS
jgi:hypothetical protein